MPLKQHRTIIQVGNTSRAVTLPPAWLRFFGLSLGDKLLVIGDGVLVVAPPHLEQRAREILKAIDEE